MTKDDVSDGKWSQSLERLSRLPDGLVYPRAKTSLKLSVWKEGSQLHLIFFSGTSTEVQARMDLSDPLYLLSPYTQAMMLGLVWAPDPKRIHVIGFGAGRLPMVLHAYFPRAVIDCTETDREVVRVAQKFFEVQLDAKLRVTFKDGRCFFDDLDSAIQYDMILIDAFDGSGSSPFLLSTRECYESCKSHLTEQGVVVVNMLLSDRLYTSKVKTLLACFSDTWMVSTSDWGGAVFFGSKKREFSSKAISRRAHELAVDHDLLFPFEDHARRIVGRDELSSSIDAISEARILIDADVSLEV